MRSTAKRMAEPYSLVQLATFCHYSLVQLATFCASVLIHYASLPVTVPVFIYRHVLLNSEEG